MISIEVTIKGSKEELHMGTLLKRITMMITESYQVKDVKLLHTNEGFQVGSQLSISAERRKYIPVYREGE
jgi:hypothetical protein